VGVAWIGFDQPKKLGNGETGGSAALPIWIGYMGKALKNVPESFMPTPEGLVTVKLPADGTGEAASKATELIYKESLPPPPPPESSEPESPQKMTFPPPHASG
jgi:penicillin-binding protein 1A